jgi:hypothetical protein
MSTQSPTLNMPPPPLPHQKKTGQLPIFDTALLPVVSINKTAVFIPDCDGFDEWMKAKVRGRCPFPCLTTT